MSQISTDNDKIKSQLNFITGYKSAHEEMKLDGQLLKFRDSWTFQNCTFPSSMIRYM